MLIPSNKSFHCTVGLLSFGAFVALSYCTHLNGTYGPSLSITWLSVDTRVMMYFSSFTVRCGTHNLLLYFLKICHIVASRSYSEVLKCPLTFKCFEIIIKVRLVQCFQLSFFVPASTKSSTSPLSSCFSLHREACVLVLAPMFTFRL